MRRDATLIAVFCAEAGEPVPEWHRSGRGGPRKGAGRKPYADPTTAEEAIAMLRPYLTLPDDAYPTPAGNVGLTLPGVIALLHKLRRRKKLSSARSPPRC